jgi:UDP-glucuronate 4-epimerase
MKIFITGIAGFIGYHLARKLFSQGHHVLGIDSYNNYYDVSLKRSRAAKLDDLGIEVSYGDLTSTTFKSDWYNKLNDVDAVVHLAAYAGVRYSLEFPKLYINNNIIGTQNLIEACENWNVNKVLYASTSSVMNGNPVPWDENTKLYNQKHPYGYSKVVNESQFQMSSIENTIGMRFFTVYGPWGRPDMALFDFTKNILAGNEISVFNNGDMVRDFTYIDDIVNGVTILLEQSGKNIYNIGRGEKVQLMDFIHEIEKNLNQKAKIKMAPMHPADAKETWSNTDKLKALGYNPKVSIAEGVENFVNWYKDYYKVN